MDELDQPASTEAEMLICDLVNGCSTSRKGTNAPCMVIPHNRGYVTKTKGQVSERAIDELVSRSFAHLLGETPPQLCELTLLGKAYYDRHLKTL